MSVRENPYACAYCPESFPVAEDLVKHFEIMHEHVEYPKKEKYAKDQNKSNDEMPKKTTEFIENKEFNKPLNNEVNKDKKYSCVFCPKKFYLKHHLQYHEKVHGG